MMYCAVCGTKMNKTDHGAWQICCKGVGYWLEGSPLSSDSWWPVTKHGKYTFYPTVYWPKNLKPVAPKMEL